MYRADGYNLTLHKAGRFPFSNLKEEEVQLPLSAATLPTHTKETKLVDPVWIPLLQLKHAEVEIDHQLCIELITPQKYIEQRKAMM
jgi:hypothetical protein